LAAVNTRLASEIAERRRVEEELRHNAGQLQKNNQDLERFSQCIVGREDRVIELKQEVNALLRELGRPPSYLIDKATLTQPQENDRPMFKERAVNSG